MTGMNWFEDNVGKVVAVSVAVIISIFVMGWWVTSTTVESETPAAVENANKGTNDTSELPTPGTISRDPRNGELPSEYVTQFFDKLNEVSRYLEAVKPGEMEASRLYREMWEWGQLGGLTLRGMDTTGKVVVSNLEGAKPTPLVAITTMEGLEYCSVRIELVESGRSADGTQVLVADSCKNIISNR